jgi:uncharacterized protein (TIGR00288 family)
MTPQQHNHLPRPLHKEPPPHAPNAALLIDFDNVTMGIRSDLQSELKRLLQSEIIRGKVAVQRAYADWRRYPQYIVPLSESSIDLIFAPAYGSNKKNATDIRLAIDALELVFTRPEIGTFILLSGDSDFSSLVLKLKEYGKYVIGVGIRESSSDLLIQNCDEYYSYNELAGFTKESDVEYVRRDPWELVVEAVKQMTAHNDVMRSDRLKQVMQEIDPNFDEKDAGFSRFSKFVVEAAHRGLIALTRLDNGQYEIALGPQVVGALAQPALGAGVPAPERAPREREGRGRRGGRGGGRGREDREHRAAPTAPAEPVEPAAPAAAAERKGGFSFGDAFGLLKQAIGRMGGEDRPVSAEELRDAMAEIKSDTPPLETAQVQKLLRQAHDKEMIDLAKEDEGYTVKLRADAPPAPPAPPRAPAAAEAHVSEEDDIPMPASSAPPPPYSAHPPSPGGVPARSARFRRGSRGPRVAPPAPDTPKIGVVEVDPTFRPRMNLVPPSPKPPVAPLPSEPGPDEGRRGGRGGRGGGGRAPAEERGERGERGGRSRRGGRGRGGSGARGGRGGQGRETREERPAARSEPSPPPPAPPATPPPPPATPRPRAPEPEADGESFWSKVKRGLTGGE